MLSGTIPTELSGFRDLEKLKLTRNGMFVACSAFSLFAVPRSFSSLLFTGMSGTIPSELGMLSSLVEFTVSIARLSGTIPSELSGLESLIQLRLSHNRLTGTIPSELAMLMSLQEIALHNNSITASLPEDICHLPQIEEIHVDCVEKVVCPAACNCDCRDGF